jgi:hypothetical protein
LLAEAVFNPMVEPLLSGGFFAAHENSAELFNTTEEKFVEKRGLNLVT